MPTNPARLPPTPTVVLHDHLDGGLRPTTVIELAEACGWAARLPTTDPTELQAWFTRGADTRDILQYLATFEHTTAVMQTAEAIERVAFEAAVDLATDGVVYAEVRFAPELHQQRGLPLEEIVGAVTAGFRRGEAHSASGGLRIVVNVILCAMRTERRSLEIARLADRMRAQDDKVVGFDLAGAETGWPPSLHAEAFAYARAAHLNITVHASEPPDLELISDGIAQGAHRIGHGVRLLTDVRLDHDRRVISMGSLAQHVLDRGIHLEMAPTCNVQVGAVPSIAEHPIGPFLRAGFRVNVNTDNRLMSNVTVSSEVEAVRLAFGLSWQEIGLLAEHGLASAFAPFAVRDRILREIVRPAYAALGQGIEGSTPGR
jgi:adenosine deaminase